MVVDAAGALQQSIGRPLVVSESAQWPYGATNQVRRHSLQRLFASTAKHTSTKGERPRQTSTNCICKKP
jgi:hypothetical protein